MAPPSARQALNPAIQAVILEYKQKKPDLALHVALGPAGAVVLTEETMRHDRLEQLIQLARNVESAVDGNQGTR